MLYSFGNEKSGNSFSAIGYHRTLASFTCGTLLTGISPSCKDNRICRPCKDPFYMALAESVLAIWKGRAGMTRTDHQNDPPGAYVMRIDMLESILRCLNLSFALFLVTVFINEPSLNVRGRRTGHSPPSHIFILTAWKCRNINFLQTGCLRILRYGCAGWFRPGVGQWRGSACWAGAYLLRSARCWW
jgi:hypothetical protein